MFGGKSKTYNDFSMLLEATGLSAGEQKYLGHQALKKEGGEGGGEEEEEHFFSAGSQLWRMQLKHNTTMVVTVR